MCRSSRFLVFLLALLAAPALAQAGGISARIGVGFGARPFVGVPRIAIRPGGFAGPRLSVGTGLRSPLIRPGFVRPGFVKPGFVRPGFVRPGLAGSLRGSGRFGRFGRGLGYGNLGVFGAATSMLDLDPPLLPDDGYGSTPPQPEPAAVPPAPPPCIRPLIIQVGKGLRRPARTKVIYGSPPPCGY